MKVGRVKEIVNYLLQNPPGRIELRTSGAIPRSGAPFPPERPIPLPKRLENARKVIMDINGRLNKSPEVVALMMPAALPAPGVPFVPPPAVTLGNAILRVSEDHYGYQNDLKMLTKLADEICQNMRGKSSKGCNIPSHVTVFIKTSHETFSKKVPAAAYPFLNAIGFMDYTLESESSKANPNLRWLMAQQISRLVLSANTFRWDYSDADLFARIGELFKQFLDGEVDFGGVSINQVREIAERQLAKEVQLTNSGFTPKRAADIENAVKNYFGVERDDQSLMEGIALAHIWDNFFCRERKIEQERINVFCMAIASALTGVDLKAEKGPLEVFCYGEETQKLAERTNIDGRVLLDDFFAGKITYLDIPS